MKVAYINPNVFDILATRKAGEMIKMCLVKADGISAKKDYEILAFLTYPDGTQAVEVISQDGDMVVLKKEPNDRGYE